MTTSLKNSVRFIEAFVLSLDLVELGFARATPAATGRPGYDPADLLKLYIYGYLNRVRSSRLLERGLVLLHDYYPGRAIDELTGGL